MQQSIALCLISITNLESTIETARFISYHKVRLLGNN